MSIIDFLLRRRPDKKVDAELARIAARYKRDMADAEKQDAAVERMLQNFAIVDGNRIILASKAPDDKLCAVKWDNLMKCLAALYEKYVDHPAPIECYSVEVAELMTAYGNWTAGQSSGCADEGSGEK